MNQLMLSRFSAAEEANKNPAVVKAFEAFQARLMDPKASVQHRPTQSTENIGNEVSDAATFANNINAPIASGVSKFDPLFYFENATIEMKAQQQSSIVHSTTNAQLSRRHTTTSIADPSPVASRGNVSSRAASAPTIAYPQMTAAASKAVPKDFKPSAVSRDSESRDQYTVGPTDEALLTSSPYTLEEYASWFKDVGQLVKMSYNDNECLLTQHSPLSKERDKLLFDIRVQREMFTMHNKSLHQSVSKMSQGITESEEFLDGACDRVYLALQSLERELRRLQQCIRTHPSGRTEDGGIMFTKWFGRLERRFKKYVEATSDIDECNKPKKYDLEHGLKKLSTTAQASSLLKQCLCRACPEMCHESHTAYLSLEPDEPDASPGQSIEKVNQPGLEESSMATWQCDMAFKSTITEPNGLIWLRVKSTVVVETSSLLGSVIQAPPKENIHESAISDTSATELDEADYVSDNKPRKRRASAMPLKPALKAQMTRQGQTRRMMDPDPHVPSGVEVCPEYLRQHDTTEDVIIMKMVDSSGCNHQISYLPQEEWSAFGVEAKGITLHKILLQEEYVQSRSLLWFVRLARLVAEAVLRFDLLHSDYDLVESIVLYGVDPKSDVFLSPFLRVEIKKQRSPTDISEINHNDDHPQPSQPRRHHVLLNPAFILLQLSINVFLSHLLKVSIRKHGPFTVASEINHHYGNGQSSQPRWHHVLLNLGVMFLQLGIIVFLSPFLKNNVRKYSQSTATSETDHDDNQGQSSQPKPDDILLDLGFILLQLGTRGKEMGPMPRDLEKRRKYIDSNADKTTKAIDIKYSMAVRSCARFFRKENHMDDVMFRLKFFENIVQPLKDCEMKIIDMQEKVGNTTRYFSPS